MKKLYIGNLSYQTNEDELQEVFEKIGPVSSCKIIRDKMDNSSRGFGFVEYDDDSNGDRAIEELDGYDLNGRALRVSEARERRDDRGGSGGGGRGGRPGGGGGRRDGGRGGYRGDRGDRGDRGGNGGGRGGNW
ncbi:MAG: RNA-binding protein [Bdellovibrionales bacterium]|nr:RNA-binding protein [Bdellovibrionales bacterium]